VKLDIAEPKGYDIACALRGPDLPYTNMLKWALTCRIRYLAGCRDAPCRRERLPTPEAEEALQQAQQADPFHYLRHVWAAAEALGDTDLARLTKELCFPEDEPMTAERFAELAGGD